MGTEADVDEVEAKAQRKAARRAAKEAAAEEEVPVTESKAKKAKRDAKVEPDVAATDDEEAKRLRKAAKKAAKEAAAAEVAEAAETPKRTKKEKRAAAEDDDAEIADVASVKKSKRADVDESKEAESKKNDLKVFIKGLPYSVDESKLRQDFEECGEITAFKMPINEMGTPKGFAFIQFATQVGFDAALKFDNTDYCGRYLNVSKADDKDNIARKGKAKEGDWSCPNCSELVFASKTHCRKCGTANPSGGGNSDNTIFIRGLPWAVTEEALRKDFGDCGEIEKLSLPKNDAGKPKGISFITYKSKAGVDAALKFDSTEYGGRPIFVTVAGDAPAPKGKGVGKDGKGKGKDGKGKDGKGKSKGKEGKAKFVPTAAFASKNGSIVEGAGEKTTFADSDDED